MDRTPFHLFGPSHWLAVFLSIAAAAGLVRLLRRRRGDVKVERAIRITLAVVLFAAVLADPVITGLRYLPEGSELAWRKVHETAWPFYLCDWAAVICGLALLRRSQVLTEIGWCWGMGGTLQGLVYPTSLSYDLPNPDWFAFFAEHGGVPVAGMVLVFGLGLRPLPGAMWRAWLALCGYLTAAAVVNLLFIHAGDYPLTNYGFVCSSDYSPFDILGPWPVYVFGMALVLGLFFAILTTPFCGRAALDPRCIRLKRLRHPADADNNASV